MQWQWDPLLSKYVRRSRRSRRPNLDLAYVYFDDAAKPKTDVERAIADVERAVAAGVAEFRVDVVMEEPQHVEPMVVDDADEIMDYTLYCELMEH